MGYKTDQGRLTRMAAFWSLALLVFYGCVSLNRTLSEVFGGALSKPLAEGMRKLPVVGLPLNAALLVTTVILGGGLFLLYRWQQKPKVADLLIETESELRKVTWPTVPEAVQSSLVVMACVAILMAFLAGADWLLGQWTTLILTGGS